MFKGTIKYCFLSAFCGLLFSSLFILTSQTQTSTRGIDSGTISFPKDFQSQKLNSNNLGLYNAAFIFSNFSEKISTLKCKIVIQKRKHQNKPKVIDKLEAKLLTINFSNAFQKDSSQSKLINQSNHCCFLI